ncbi:MAG: 30S ribosomal protein S20 [Candidatus Wildermuthbacteria bacterium]|nr:30S ribosomal protein S20 [Candidatus Wildermuthbacteria bacterium]
MPITSSAKKALRQSIKRREKNLIQRNKVKAILKQEKELLSKKNLGDAARLLSQAFKALDKAAKTGLIKKNTASRRKSRLAKALKKLAS